QFRGWGELAVRGVANWYLEKPVDKLVRDVTKYVQRDGWGHRDVLRLAHPNPAGTEDATLRADVFNYITKHGVEGEGSLADLRGRSVYNYIAAVEEIRACTNPTLAASL